MNEFNNEQQTKTKGNYITIIVFLVSLLGSAIFIYAFSVRLPKENAKINAQDSVIKQFIQVNEYRSPKY